MGLGKVTKSSSVATKRKKIVENIEKSDKYTNRILTTALNEIWFNCHFSLCVFKEDICCLFLLYIWFNLYRHLSFLFFLPISGGHEMWCESSCTWRIYLGIEKNDTRGRCFCLFNFRILVFLKTFNQLLGKSQSLVRIIKSQVQIQGQNFKTA